MSFNLKKYSQRHYDKSLEKNRKDRGHDNWNNDGTLNNLLDQDRKNSDEKYIYNKRLEKHHNQPSQQTIIEERFNSSERWRDDRTWKTNTLPINELAEEMQRKRLKSRGEEPLDKSHFQKYKNESKNLYDMNFSDVKKVSDDIQGIWRKVAGNRLTSKEKIKLAKLYSKLDQSLYKK